MVRTDVSTRTGKASADPAFWLLIGQLIMFTGVAAVFPIAPLYVAHRGGNSVAVAIFIAGPLVANTLVQVPAGRLCDRWGRKPFLIGPRLVYAFLSLFLFFNIGTLPVLTGIRIIMGACAGAYAPALRAALTDLSEPEQRAQRFSQLQAYEMVGLLVGPFVGGAAALWRDSAVFGITGLSMFIGLGAMFRVPEFARRGHQHRGPKGAIPLVAHPRHRGIDRRPVRGRHHLVDVRRCLARNISPHAARTRSSSGCR